MIDRYDPFGRAMGLRQVMDRLLEDAFVMPRQGGDGGGPAMDVYEEDDALVVEAHVSGFKPDDLDINVEHGVLTISGQAKAEQERKERNYLVREQRTGRFSRSLRLPGDVRRRCLHGAVRGRRAAPDLPEVRGRQAAPHPDRRERPAGHDERPGRGQGVTPARAGRTRVRPEH